MNPFLSILAEFLVMTLRQLHVDSKRELEGAPTSVYAVYTHAIFAAL